MRCERCGKFRSASDVARTWHGDQTGGDVTECRWCMSPADRDRFGMVALDLGPVSGDGLARYKALIAEEDARAAE